MEDKKSRKSKDSKLHGVYQNLAEAVSSIKIEPQLQFNGLWGSGGNGKQSLLFDHYSYQCDSKQKMIEFFMWMPQLIRRLEWKKVKIIIGDYFVVYLKSVPFINYSYS